MRSRRVGTPTLVLTGTLVAVALFSATLVRHLWFVGDEWSFLVGRTADLDTRTGLLAPHNEHWSTLPLLAYRGLFTVFGLRHYLPYAIVPIVLHLSACVLMHRLLRASGARPWPAVLATVVMALPALGAENILWAFQIGFLGSAVFGLAAVVALETGNATWRNTVSVWLYLIGSMLCSGMALPMLMFVGICGLSRREFSRTVKVTGLPILVYLTWYLAFGRHATAQSPPSDVAAMAKFALVGLDRIWEPLVGFPGSGLLVLAVLVVPLMVTVDRGDRRLRRCAIAALVAMLATYVLLAFSRAGLGTGAATVSRYAWFGVMFLVPALALGFSAVARSLADRVRLLQVVVVLVMTVVVGREVVVMLALRDQWRAMVGDLPGRVVAAADLVAGEEQLLSSEVEPRLSHDITVARLRPIEVRRALPDVRPSAQERLNARAALQVAVIPRRLDVPMATEVAGTKGVRRVSTSGSCLRGLADETASLVLPPSVTGTQAVVSVTGFVITTVLTSADGRSSAPVRWRARPDEPTWVGTSVPGSRLVVSVPPGPVEICLAGSQP